MMVPATDSSLDTSRLVRVRDGASKRCWDRTLVFAGADGAAAAAPSVVADPEKLHPVTHPDPATVLGSDAGTESDAGG